MEAAPVDELPPAPAQPEGNWTVSPEMYQWFQEQVADLQARMRVVEDAERESRARADRTERLFGLAFDHITNQDAQLRHMVAANLPIGDRIRHYRGGRRQDAVAGLVGISPDYLSQVERGLKVPSLPILYALAQELGVPAAALLPEKAPAEDETTDTAEAAVARALLGYGPARGATPVAASVLRARVESAWRSWQTDPDRFTQAAATLSDLVAETTRRPHLNDESENTS